jgi:hypothetical protein
MSFFKSYNEYISDISEEQKPQKTNMVILSIMSVAIAHASISSVKLCIP